MEHNFKIGDIVRRTKERWAELKIGVECRVVALKGEKFLVLEGYECYDGYDDYGYDSSNFELVTPASETQPHYTIY